MSKNYFIISCLVCSLFYVDVIAKGSLFPLLFIGGTLGQVLSEILTFIPQGVGVLAGMAGAACAFFPIPLTLALLLGLFGGQTDLIPVIVIGAVIGFIVSKAVAPLVPKPRPQPGINKQ